MDAVAALAAAITTGAVRPVVVCAALLLLVLFALRVRAQCMSSPARSRRARIAGFLIMFCALATAAEASLPGMSAGLVAEVQKLWGSQAAERVQAWRHEVLSSDPAESDLDQLAAVNAYWNRTRYAADPRQWGQADYWATPIEMLGSNGGDCEDYVFGKYFTLRELGMPAAKLRITYVRAAGLAEGHMVLAYYAAPDGEPLILDNLTDEILPASRRDDLQPVYSFNDDDLWAAGVSGRAGGANQVRAWRELLDKMARERAL